MTKLLKVCDVLGGSKYCPSHIGGTSNCDAVPGEENPCKYCWKRFFDMIIQEGEVPEIDKGNINNI